MIRSGGGRRSRSGRVFRRRPHIATVIAFGILNLQFNAITFFPDGSVWDQFIADDARFDAAERYPLSNLVTFDCKFRKSEVPSPIGTLNFDWIGSDQFGFGGASWFVQDQLINFGVFLLGSNPENDSELLDQYLGNWRGTEITQRLRPDGNAFSECLEIHDRPLMVSLNSGALQPDAYEPIASYDLYLASLFFSGLHPA